MTDWTKYSTTAANNTAAPPDGFPEGQAANTVNNCLRDMAAMIRGLGDQVAGSSIQWCGTAGGTKNALTLTPTPAITAYAAGQIYRFKTGSTQSDSTVTITVSGLTSPAAQSNGAAFSSTIYLEASKWYEALYDGAAFQVRKFFTPDGFAGAFGGSTFGGNITPLASDGAALGTSSLMWSDLFLASGGVVNWNNGDVTLTHSADTLAFAGAASGYTFDNFITLSGAAAALNVSTGTSNPIVLDQYAATAVGSQILFRKSRHATIGSHTIVQSGDVLMRLLAYGSNGTTFDNAGYLEFAVGATPGASADMPGEFRIFLSPDGSATATQRFTISAANLLTIPGVHANTTASAANINVDSSGNIKEVVSSRRYKKDITDYTRTINDLDKLRPVFYHSINADDKKTHVGFIAEEVADSGLEEYVVRDEHGRPNALEYQNMVALLVKVVKDQDQRIQALEAKLP